MPVALIVDDEPDIRELLAITLARMQVESLAAENLAEARQLLQEHAFDLCLTDMRLPDGNGMELIRYLQQNYPHIPVAMITAHGNMQSAIEALKAGAFDFLNKPVELQALRDLIESALRLQKEVPVTSNGATARLLGRSNAIENIRTKIRKLARSQAPVYISGESGTGKELVARLIHEMGPRADNPFIPVNCGAIPAELMESELFGHIKGSFTGANSNKDGLFQAANGGTLFLDEVADLPLSMQVKLLRAIQEKAIRPVGAQREVHVDVRILSATHKDLGRMIRDGAFREDLFYRINVIELHIPPLRERQEDVPLMVEHILARTSRQMGIPQPEVVASAQQALNSYPYPGNIRELENILERALTLCEDNLITEDDLQLPANRQCDGEAKPLESVGLENYLNDIEKSLLQDTLEKTGHNKTAAAKQLGLTFRSLRYRLKKLGLE